MKKLSLLAIGMLLAGSSAAIAQNDVPGYPGVKVVPVQATTPAAKPAGGETARQQLFADLTVAGYTHVKIMAGAFIVQAVNKAGEPVKMLLTPDSVTIITVMDAQPPTTPAPTTAPPAATPAAPAKP